MAPNEVVRFPGIGPMKYSRFYNMQLSRFSELYVLTMARWNFLDIFSWLCNRKFCSSFHCAIVWFFWIYRFFAIISEKTLKCNYVTYNIDICTIIYVVNLVQNYRCFMYFFIFVRFIRINILSFSNWFHGKISSLQLINRWIPLLFEFRHWDKAIRVHGCILITSMYVHNWIISDTN